MRVFYYRGRGWKYIPASKKNADSIRHEQVVGDVFVRRDRSPVAQVTAQREDGELEQIPAYSYKEKLGFTERVVGYIPDQAQEGKYGRIIQKSMAKIVVPIVLLLLVAACVLFYFRPWQQDTPGLDQAAIAYQMPNGVKNEDPNRIMMPFFDEIRITNQGQGKVALLNPEGNECYFKYTLTLDETGQTVYESGLIKPAMAVTEWYLNTELAPGEYTGMLQIETSDLQDYTQQANGSNFTVKVIVEE